MKAFECPTTERAKALRLIKNVDPILTRWSNYFDDHMSNFGCNPGETMRICIGDTVLPYDEPYVQSAKESYVIRLMQDGWQDVQIDFEPGRVDYDVIFVGFWQKIGWAKPTRTNFTEYKRVFVTVTAPAL